MIWNIEGILEKVGLISNPVGFAFSGGGARGFSHIGVLKAFEQFGIHPDVMSGVSAGSVAAVLYASGLTPDEMLQCFESVSKLNEFVSWKVPGNSILKIDKFGRLLESWLPFKYLEDLKIPTVVCATDFINSKSVGWGKVRSCLGCWLPVPYRLPSSLFASMTVSMLTEEFCEIFLHGLSGNTARLYMASIVRRSTPCGRILQSIISLRWRFAATI